MRIQSLCCIQSVLGFSEAAKAESGPRLTNEQRRDQKLRLRAFIEREQKAGTSFDETFKRLCYTYTNKAMEKHEVCTLYDNFQLGDRAASVLIKPNKEVNEKDLQLLPLCTELRLQPLCRSYLQLPYRCCALFDSVDSRYVFVASRTDVNKFYILDTFHDDHL